MYLYYMCISNNQLFYVYKCILPLLDINLSIKWFYNKIFIEMETLFLLLPTTLTFWYRLCLIANALTGSTLEALYKPE